MNEEPTLFTQTIKCPKCDTNGFSIAEVNVEKAKVTCKKCGDQFYLFGERAGELLARTLGREQARQDRLTTGELLETKLHSFEVQVGERGEAASLLFSEYIESLFDGVIQSIDETILKRLQKRFLNVIKSRGMGDGGPALEKEIEKHATWALRSAGYTLVEDDENEN